MNDTVKVTLRPSSHARILKVLQQRMSGLGTTTPEGIAEYHELQAVMAELVGSDDPLSLTTFEYDNLMHAGRNPHDYVGVTMAVYADPRTGQPSLRFAETPDGHVAIAMSTLLPAAAIAHEGPRVLLGTRAQDPDNVQSSRSSFIDERTSSVEVRVVFRKVALRVDAYREGFRRAAAARAAALAKKAAQA